MHNIKINKPNLCEERTQKPILNPKHILPFSCMFMIYFLNSKQIIFTNFNSRTI